MSARQNIFKGRLFLLVLVLPFLVSCRSIRFYTESTTKIHPEKHIDYFPDDLNESSGLEKIGDKMLSFNDSGGEAELFFFPPLSPMQISKVKIPGISNIDWEDIAKDSNYLYIGDFGNNNGTRDTLIIYRIAIEGIMTNNISAETISFSYVEMDSTHLNKARNSFDCEAMTMIDDSLWIFTKNWKDESSWVYKLPAIPGHYELKLKAVLEPAMLVTGADYSINCNILYLLGYHGFRPRIRAYYFDGNSFHDYFLVRFDNRFGVHTEGIFAGEEGVYFSNEKSLRKPGLFYMKIEQRQ